MKNSGTDLEFVYNRSENDGETFDHFKGIKINDMEIEEKYYTAESGSVKIKISAAYLDYLQPGGYQLTPLFDDWEAEGAAFNVEASKETPTPTATPSPTSTPTRTPDGGKGSANTGDAHDMILWLLLAAAAAGVLALAAGKKKH